jgi:hypothetical protein
MKGIVFSEFMDLVEERFGLETMDEVIESSDLASGGSYTAVGTYPHSEMVNMVVRLSEITKLPVDKLLNVFGHHLFQTFHKNYPSFFSNVLHPFDLLEQIDNHIHVEVKKLYPDAELPRFETSREGDVLTMIYRSERKMSDLAMGLMEASALHYKQDLKIEREMLKADGSEVKFKIS